MGLFEKLTRFFCACAPGIAIGLWSAHQLGFWWPVGALIGAMASYLLVEWKGVVLAIPKACSRATSWQPDKELWVYRRLAILGFLSVISSSVVLLLATIWLDAYAGPTGLFDKASSEITTTPLFFVVVGGFGIALASFITACSWLFAMLYLVIRREVGFMDYGYDKMFREAIKFGNPLAVFFYWPARGLWNTPRGIMWFFSNVVWAVLLFCGRFSRALLFIIHSRKRTLCAATTFITVVIGYVVDGDLIAFTLVGAAIGGLYSISSWRDWVIVKVQPQS